MFTSKPELAMIAFYIFKPHQSMQKSHAHCICLDTSILPSSQKLTRMNAPPSRSPSPPPDAPIASAPGPRATALQRVFAGALSASIKANSDSNFSACFPTPAKHCPDALKAVRADVNTRLEQECMRDFEQILADRQVVEGLNQWESMIDEARKRRDRAVDGEVPQRP